jgi:hypothetical protein
LKRGRGITHLPIEVDNRQQNIPIIWARFGPSASAAMASVRWPTENNATEYPRQILIMD